MPRCANVDCHRECWLGVNAVYLNPANWNDKRLECDDCAGITRDEAGRIVYQRIMEPAEKVSETWQRS